MIAKACGGAARLHRPVLACVAALLIGPLSASSLAAPPPRLRAVAVQDGLTNPWDVAFAPDGRMLLSERPGRIRVYSDGSRRGRLLRTTRIAGVRAEGEAGVMGLAVRRGVNGRTEVYVCASRTDRGVWRNQVLRYVLGADHRLRPNRYIIRNGMRAARIHNGCAVALGPDRKIWVTMGDAADLSTPQRRASLNGKVLRVNPDGTIPGDNPFRRSPVYSLGHRNPQGIAFSPLSKHPYVVEHGPDRNDEINRIRRGGNYGWPCWTGRRSRGPLTAGCGSAGDYRRPAWASGFPTLATSGAAFFSGARWGSWRNHLAVATLKHSDLRRFRLSATGNRAEQAGVLFDQRWGRLRAAARGTNASLYLTTSNGSDDRVIRVWPTLP